MINILQVPEFSVLMSVYNKENASYLEDSLKSIERQTYQPKEIILVEDGPLSCDLLTVIENYQKILPILTVRLKENRGLSEALNAGVHYVHTKWIARMDTDDIAVVNRFELQFKKICSNPQIDILGGQVADFRDTVDNIIGYRKVPIDFENIKKFSKYRSPLNHPTVVIKKEVLIELGGYGDIQNLEDYQLWGKAITESKIVCNLDKVLVFMRTNSGLYGRRGGFIYLDRYFRLRKYLRKIGLISTMEQLTGDLFMLISASIPTALRRFAYTNFLHKK